MIYIKDVYVMLFPCSLIHNHTNNCSCSLCLFVNLTTTQGDTI